MRALLPLLLLVATAAAAQMPEPRVVRINDRVHVLLGPIQHANPVNQGYMINSTVIIGAKGVILVDSGGSAEVGRHIASAVRRSGRTSTGTWYVAPPTRRLFTSTTGLRLASACLKTLTPG